MTPANADIPNGPETLPEAPLRQSLLHIPPAAPFKNAASNYLKHDHQTIWSRNARNLLKEPSGLVEATPRGSDIIVIHPGSRWIRVGRATDAFPVSVPHVLARKVTSNHKPPPQLIRVLKTNADEDAMDTDEIQEIANPAEVTECITTIRAALRSRMDFYRIPYEEEGSKQATIFNEGINTEEIDGAQDVYKVDWVTGQPEDAFFIGHKVFRLADPAASGYEVRWPMYNNHFNTRYYPSRQEALSDIEIMWKSIITQELGIPRAQFKNYSAVLVIPDYFDKQTVSHLVDMLLTQLDFKRVCIQQEGLAACVGSGLTTACIVDIGAVKTSVSCVEDGILLSDTRMLLDYGGDDITEFLHDLLKEIKFPYKNIKLNRLYDLHVMDDLKARLCTLSEADVASRAYDFFVRAPGKATEKYLLKAYDETIVAPMCIFEPKIIDFDSKKRVNPKRWDLGNIDDGELGSENPTPAMIISTQHLLQPMGEGRPRPNIDVKFEAGKLPLDVAIFNSVRAAGNEKIKKFLQTVVVVGGTSLIPGAVHALESRLQAIAFPLVPNIERLQVLTTHPDVDPRVVTWKGVSIISKLESLSDLWITKSEWDILGMRCLRERSMIDRPTVLM
ncbi:actin-like protein arp8 [Tulasnella sp. UAMH 9824]|nr:actin-like protein arp8 [Tulasnella sp. UAMH 9824]